MPYKVQTDGSIECESAEEALRLSGLMQSAQKTDPPAEKPQKKGRKPFEPAGDDLLAKKMLRIVFGSGADGISTNDLAGKLGVKPKGLGSISTRVRRLIAASSNGHPVEDYFWKWKPRAGPSVWYAARDKLRSIGFP